jgi:hypothetical protein
MKSSKKHKPTSRSKSNLQSLTAAALILPGLLQVPAYAADEDEVDFQYTHYQEGNHAVYVNQNFFNGGPYLVGKTPNYLNPIEVEGLHGGAHIKLTDRVKFAFNYTQDTWAGATPLASAPVVSNAAAPVLNLVTKTITGATPLLRNIQSNPFYIDKQGNIHSQDYHFDYTTYTGTVSPGAIVNQVTNVLVGASPETRKQGDFKLGYDWDNAAITGGGGISVENDYDSRFGNLGLRLDFNQKRTSVNAGVSYTNSDTHATLDPRTAGWITTGSPYPGYLGDGSEVTVGNKSTFTSYSPQTEGTFKEVATFSSGEKSNMIISDTRTLTGNRQDVAGSLGLTQILTQNALLDLGVSYTHSAGYLSNPYKAVYVFNAQPGQDPSQPLLYSGLGQWEARPHERNQVNGNLGYHYYIEPLNAALHAQYTVAHDDWGINAHTFSADWAQPLGAGWTVTPKVRYYSQSAADFYAPYFTTIISGYDPVSGAAVYSKALSNYYSSDQRLSGFGAISGGLTIAKQFAKGVSLESGFEYYSHQGGLKLGGGGEQAFADYDFWMANAALKLNLGALNFGGGHDSSHASPSHHQAVITPAGIMFNHALDKAGDMMVGYRYMRNEQSDSILSGSSAVSSDTVKAQGCSDQTCTMIPNNMVMNMHMLELMVAATDRLTLMLMPQWTDMDMKMSMPNMKQMNTGMGHADPVMNQQSGGIGDTGLYALIKLFEQPGHQLTLSLGGTAPTGDIGVLHTVFSPAYPFIPLDYSMQLGSGTWDLKTSLTYSGTLEAFAWGAQATGTKRLDKRNQSGYALGDIFQSSVWGGYQWTHWLSSTVRGVYTWQDSIRGEFKPIVSPDGSTTPYSQYNANPSPTEYTGNYGGQFVDLGLGVSVTVPSGTFAGNTIKFEWLQPVHTDYNGYQLDRSAALTATWGVGF